MTERPDEAAEAVAEAATQRAQRVLLVTVIVLGILLIIGFAIVVATIASRMAGAGAEGQAAGSSVAAGAAGAARGAGADPTPVALTGQDIRVALPDGYRVVSVSGDARRLVVHLAGPPGAPARLMVLDTRTGEVLRELVLAPER